jgi:hypothetical protein
VAQLVPIPADDIRAEVAFAASGYRLSVLLPNNESIPVGPVPQVSESAVPVLAGQMLRDAGLVGTTRLRWFHNYRHWTALVKVSVTV